METFKDYIQQISEAYASVHLNEKKEIKIDADWIPNTRDETALIRNAWDSLRVKITPTKNKGIVDISGDPDQVVKILRHPAYLGMSDSEIADFYPELKKNLSKKPIPKAGAAKTGPAKDQTVVGNFNVVLPKELKGTLGSANTKLTNPRAIVDADDEESNMIKKLLHDTKAGIKVRIMKRAKGNKVYIDAKDENAFKLAMDKLAEI